jgi:carboxyl-terminal processing protease
MSVSQKRRSYRLYVWIVLSGGFIGMFAGSQIAQTSVTTYEKLDIFSDVLSTIQNAYVEDAEVEQLIYGAIEGMLNKLDPHSSFLDREAYREMQVDTTGTFGGLGIEISILDGVLTVVAPIEDTPASRAGVLPEDRILAIDGESTDGMTLMDAVRKMRGPRGSKVTISISREAWPETKELTLTREIVQVRSVRHQRFPGDIGHIRISQFQERTARDVQRALNELEKQPLKGLILDFRNNPGGLLDQAIEIGDMFLDEGLIVYTQGKLPESRHEFRARKGRHERKYPLLVLVNGGSASASEIVAGALQDHRAAIIMGTPTFGKGSVQTIIPLKDGSALRLTTAKYFTPNGRSIQATGIEPDVLVEQTLMGELADTGARVRERDLERHLESERKGDDQKSGREPSPEDNDYQLQRALELLRSYSIFSQLHHVAQ